MTAALVFSAREGEKLAQDPFWQNKRQRPGGEEDKSLTAKWRVEGRKKLFFTVELIVGTDCLRRGELQSI